MKWPFFKFNKKLLRNETAKPVFRQAGNQQFAPIFQVVMHFTHFEKSQKCLNQTCPVLQSGIHWITEFPEKFLIILISPYYGILKFQWLFFPKIKAHGAKQSLATPESSKTVHSGATELCNNKILTTETAKKASGLGRGAYRGLEQSLKF